MGKFPPELGVHKANVVYLLYAAGGLLVTLTAGSLCVDVALRTAQDPAKLRRLSNTLIRLMGFRRQIYVIDSPVKRKLKRLYFTESLLEAMKTAQHRSPDFTRLMLFPGVSINCISAKRRRLHYILICSLSNQPIVTLCVADNSNELKTYSPSHRLQWLIDFSRRVHEQGDLIALLAVGQSSHIGTEPETNDPEDECYPTRLALGLSALSVVLLWMFLPHIAVCAVALLSWKVQQQLNSAVTVI